MTQPYGSMEYTALDSIEGMKVSIQMLYDLDDEVLSRVRDKLVEIEGMLDSILDDLSDDTIDDGRQEG